MEVKRSKRFVIPYVVQNKPGTTLTQILFQSIMDFRLKNYKNPSLIRISYEEEYLLRNEQPTYGGPLSYLTSPNMLFGIPLAICEKPVPRFEI